MIWIPIIIGLIFIGFVIKRQFFKKKVEKRDNTCLCEDFLTWSIISSVCLGEINLHRQENGLKPLKKSAVLYELADDRAEEVSKFKKLAHYGWGKWAARIKDICNTQSEAEILLRVDRKEFKDPFHAGKKMFELWKNSPSHNKVLLGDYTHIGIEYHIENKRANGVGLLAR